MSTTGDASTRVRSKPSRRDTVIRMLGLVLVAVLLWWSLTRLVSWSDVLAVMGDLTIGNWGVLTGIAIVRIGLESLLLKAVTPKLRWPKAVQGFLAPAAAVSIVPGPSDIASRYAMYRSWGYSAPQTSASVLLVFLYPLFARVSLPVVAAALLLAFGRSNARVETVAMIASGVLVAAIAMMVLLLRSEQTARRVGGAVGVAAQRVAAWFRISTPAALANDLADRAAHFSKHTGDAVRTRTHLAVGAAALGQVGLFGILLVSIRVVGIEAGQIDWVAIFAAFALVQLLTSIPITPSGLGVAEAAYIALLTAASSSALGDEIAAAAIAYRFFGWIVVIPLGGLAWAWWSSRLEPTMGDD